MEKNQRERRLDEIKGQLGMVLHVVDADYFVRCEVCGQFFDVRDYVEVYYHDDDPHEPLKPDA